MSKETVSKYIDQGDGYMAVEHTEFVIRNYRQQGDINGAILYLIDIANQLHERKLYDSSYAAAIKATKLIPTNAKTIKKAIKKAFLDYTFSTDTKEGRADYFDFTDSLIYILGDNDESIIKRQLQVSNDSKMYSKSEMFLHRMIFARFMKDEIPEDEIIDLLKQLANLMWSWFESFDAYTNQFVLLRTVLALLANKPPSPRLTLQFLDFFVEAKPNDADDEVLNMPLYHFANLYTKAVSERAALSTQYLVEKYKPLLSTFPELDKWIKKAEGIHFPRPAPAGPNPFAEMFQNLIGGMTQNAANGH